MNRDLLLLRSAWRWGAGLACQRTGRGAGCFSGVCTQLVSWTWWTRDPGSSSEPCVAGRPSWWWCPAAACKHTNNTSSNSTNASRSAIFDTELRPHPLLVTRHWRRPSLRKMSTTVSMGVWSVTVKGLRLRMRRSFSGCGLLAGSCGASSVK